MIQWPLSTDVFSRHYEEIGWLLSCVNFDLSLVLDIDGNVVDLAGDYYNGNVLVIMNVASE